MPTPPTPPCAEGFPEHPLAAYRYFVGDGVEALVRRALPPEQLDAATLARSVELMRREYSARWADKTRPYPAVPELLDGLTALGLPMAVLSNKPDDFTRLCVVRLLPRWRFEMVLGAARACQRSPTRPRRHVAAQFHLLPAQIVYLGDSNTDMQTAVAAGMYPVGALWGFRTAAELSASGAEVLLEKPMELLRVLGAPG